MIDRILVTSLRFEILDISWHLIVHALWEATLMKLLLDSLNSTSVLHHPFLYNDRDVMKVGSRTRSCLSASCGMCYPLLYRWTQQVELRNEKNTCRYHWLVQRESHSEQFQTPCFTHQYPLCTPAPSIPFYVTLFFFIIYSFEVKFSSWFQTMNQQPTRNDSTTSRPTCLSFSGGEFQ